MIALFKTIFFFCHSVTFIIIHNFYKKRKQRKLNENFCNTYLNLF